MFNLKDIDPAVDHPVHYAGNVECIDAIEAAIANTGDTVAGFLAGQIIKYVWRYPQKGGVQDLKKAKWYLDRLIRRVETQNERERERE